MDTRETKTLINESLNHPKTEIRLKILSEIDPITVDMVLDQLILKLSDPEDTVVEKAIRLLSLHPLFQFKKHPVSIPCSTSGCYDIDYFPQTQIDSLKDCLLLTSQQLHKNHSKRFADNLSQLDGLDNIISIDDLNFSADQKILFYSERLHRHHSLFPKQVMVSLTYLCNKKCSYCFSDPIKQNYPLYIDDGTFAYIVNWTKKTGAYRLAITGGEPTLHPKFNEFIRIINNNGLTTYFPTNGLGPLRTYKNLAGNSVESITLHILDDYMYSSTEIDKLRKVIDLIRTLGIKIIFRYVLHSVKLDCELLLKLVGERNQEAVSFSPAFPSPVAKSLSSNIQDIFALKPAILNLTKELYARGCETIFAKPIPLCMFDRKELLWLANRAKIKNVCEIYENDYTNNLVVNSDYSIFPCMALPIHESDLRIKDNLKSITDWSKKVVDPLFSMSKLDKCTTCHFWSMRICQPGCLSYSVST